MVAIVSARPAQSSLPPAAANADVTLSVQIIGDLAATQVD